MDVDEQCSTYLLRYLRLYSSQLAVRVRGNHILAMDGRSICSSVAQS